MRRMSSSNPLLAPVRGAQHHEVAGVRIDLAPAGAGRIKRVIYPVGFRWSRDMQPVTGTERCLFAHVGFLLQGQVHVEYPDGCTEEFVAPQIVTIEPGNKADPKPAKPDNVFGSIEEEMASLLGRPSGKA